MQRERQRERQIEVPAKIQEISMVKRLQHTKTLYRTSCRADISARYYVIVTTFLCFAIVLLSSSASLRWPPPDLDRIVADRQTFEKLPRQEIATNRFLKGSVRQELQQRRIGREKSRPARPLNQRSVSAKGFHDQVDFAAEIVLPADQDSTLRLTRSSVGKEEDTTESQAQKQVSGQLHDDQRRSHAQGLPHMSVGSEKSGCDGQRVYMYRLPAMFHSSVVDQCENEIVDWLNFCPHVQNQGFGRQLNDAKGKGTDWYATDPYMLEVIFHARMPYYRCFTEDPSLADAFFIPYYSGLDALRFLYGKNKSNSGSQGRELLAWLEQNAAETWRKRGGVDHFIVMGRTAWDFGRPLWVKEGWGTAFLSLPEMENVTTFFLERRPWRWNEQAIPYPTAFHPTSVRSLRDWQNAVRWAKRPFLIAFVGAPRSGKRGSSIRQSVIQQCLDANSSSSSYSSSCAFVDCQKIECAHNPNPITERLLQSEFCLQPPGDTPTRRSTFDGMLAGCIPVFFDKDSAYTQYEWHLKENADQYSVFIPKNESNRVQQVLSSYSSERIHTMRETLIDMIPRLIYASSKAVPELEEQAIEDAFDVSVKGMLRRLAEATKHR